MQQHKKLKSLTKALDILDLFLKNRSEMTLAELSKLSGLNKTTVCKIASTLVERDYLKQREKRGKYSLGTIYLDFSGIIKSKLQIRSIAIPYLVKLSQHVKESVAIALGNGTENVLIETFHDASISKNILKVDPGEAGRMPLHSTSLGKIILADMSEEELQVYFNSQNIEHYTSNTITDIDDMKNHLTLVRQKGVAFDDEEYALGVGGVAAGLRNGEGKIIGAIGVVAPSARLTRAKMRELVPQVKSCAMEISRELGFQD